MNTSQNFTIFGPHEDLGCPFIAARYLSGGRQITYSYSILSRDKNGLPQYCMRRKGIEHLVTTGKDDGKSRRGRQGENILDSL